MRKIIVPVLALFLLNCEEEEIKQTNDSSAAFEALTEYVTVNKVFQDVGNNSGDAILVAQNSQEAKTAKTKQDPEITVEPFDLTTFPKTITINYGDGLLCKDGVTRKGIVTINSTNWYRVDGSKHVTTFNNYYHNDYKVEGKHTTTNLGNNTDGNLQFSVSVENGKISKTTGESISFTESATRTWIAGSDTVFNIWDDEYLLEGSQTGTSSKDIDYTLTVEEPLHFILLPRGITSGILDVSLGSIDNIKINYATSTITIFGVSYPFGN